MSHSHSSKSNPSNPSDLSFAEQIKALKKDISARWSFKIPSEPKKFIVICAPLGATQAELKEFIVLTDPKEQHLMQAVKDHLKESLSDENFIFLLQVNEICDKYLAAEAKNADLAEKEAKLNFKLLAKASVPAKKEKDEAGKEIEVLDDTIKNFPGEVFPILFNLWRRGVVHPEEFNTPVNSILSLMDDDSLNRCAKDSLIWKAHGDDHPEQRLLFHVREVLSCFEELVRYEKLPEFQDAEVQKSLTDASKMIDDLKALLKKLESSVQEEKVDLRKEQEKFMKLCAEHLSKQDHILEKMKKIDHKSKKTSPKAPPVSQEGMASAHHKGADKMTVPQRSMAAKMSLIKPIVDRLRQELRKHSLQSKEQALDALASSRSQTVIVQAEHRRSSSSMETDLINKVINSGNSGALWDKDSPHARSKSSSTAFFDNGSKRSMSVERSRSASAHKTSSKRSQTPGRR